MKTILIIIQSVLLVLAFTSGNAVWADDVDQPGSYGMAADSESLFTPDELDDMLAPIALYPDPLIAQILPAATFIDQVDEATRYVKQYGKAARIDDKPWDVSVKAVAHYPTVLFMMDQKYDWTVSLGQAYINQQQDVLDAIQRLRASAQAVGNLKSTPEQQVVAEDGTIMIDPAEPEVIYVPQYDPEVVYVESSPYPSYGFIDFGIGFVIGAWLNRDCDWHRHRIFYHGWHGGGWIGRSRSHIHVRNNVYINNNYNVININRRVIQQDTERYHENLRRNVQVRRESGISLTPKGREAKPRERTDNRNVPQSRIAPETRLPQRPAGSEPKAAVRPATVGTTTVQRPDNKDIYRGREVKGVQPPVSVNGYGGYGSSKAAATIRQRGQASQENMRQFNLQQPAAAPVRTFAPVTRPSNAGGVRQSAPQAAPAVRSAPGAAQPGRRER